MKLACLFIIAAFSASVAPSPSAHVITGTWVADLSSQQGLPTDVYVVRGGYYSCESCAPARQYPADGKLRAVVGAPNVSEAVTIIDARTISTKIVQPDLVRTTRMKVARDGRTATYVSIDRRAGIQGPLRTEYIAKRVAPGPDGSHAASGTWQGVRYVAVPLQLRTTILSDSGDHLSYRSGSGYSFTAPFTGAFVPISGPYDGSISAAVRRLDEHRVLETRRQGGVDIQLRTYSVAPDSRSMEIATTNIASNTTFRVTARKQGVSRETR